MNFRTELHPKTADFKLNLASRIVTVGSCFSDVIGTQLEKYKVETLTNPFGTLFNPLSACKLLQICAGADVELADAFVENNGRWYSYDFHSSFSGESEEELYEKLDEAVVKTRRFLKKADVLILTLGTANIFRLNITGETVANCHKLPAANFTRETLLPEEIITAIAETHSLLRELNPNLKLILTVSPVRHIKDSLELNSVSKAVLRLATHFLTQNLPDITYFPSYELLIDDLRDYRFYKDDMLHPTTLAENYIWEKFTGAYFDENFRTFLPEWDSVLRAKAHKPFHPESAPHQAFIQNMLAKLQSLQETVNVTEEIAFFENQAIVLPEVKEEDEEELDDEAAIEETIPGYFSDETEEKEAAAETDLEAEIAETGEQAEQKKRRKKPRRKKKKQGAVTEEVSLSEVGTAALTEVPQISETPSEPAAELAEILTDPDHKIEHYGETLSEDQPVKKPLSKSAKRRESRKKKKALAALESTRTPQMPEEISEPQTDEITPNLTFSPESATVFEDQIPEIATEAAPKQSPVSVTAENAMRPEQKTPEIQPDKQKQKKGGRKKKNAFPELFANENPEAETQPSEALEEQVATVAIPAIEPEHATEKPEEEETVADKPEKAKKGRKPKKAQLFKESEPVEPVNATIAVPFLPAQELDETAVIAVPFVPVSELEEVQIPVKKAAKRGRAPKSKSKAPATEAGLMAENVSEVLEATETKPAKPAKKTAKPKAKTAEPKTTRKKKATPES